MDLGKNISVYILNSPMNHSAQNRYIPDIVKHVCTGILVGVCLLCIFRVAPAGAQEEVRLRAVANVAPRINLAVQPFVEKTSGVYHPGYADTIRTVFLRDLVMSGVFNVMDLSVTVEDSAGREKSAFLDESGVPDFELLKKLSAQALVAGEFEVRDPQIELTLHLEDVSTRRTITSKVYAAFDLTLRRVIHRMADDVVLQMTGDPGVAQTRIAYISNLTGASELYIADYDGYNVRQLTNDGARKYSPNWSPDGARIAYSSYRDGPHELYVLDMQTGETVKIESFGRTTLSPRHSPDGRYIVLGLVVEGSAKLFLCNADGTDMRPLLVSHGINVEPTWSPRGDQIAYMSDRTDDPHVYVVNIDGSDDHRITFEGKYNGSPAWSPRGDRIAFVAGDTLTTYRGLERIFNIYTSDVNGENLMRLTGIEGIQGNNMNPTWSPDGLHILFGSDRDRAYGDQKIYIMNWDGSGVRTVITSGHNITPSWGPRP